MSKKEEKMTRKEEIAALKREMLEEGFAKKKKSKKRGKKEITRDLEILKERKQKSEEVLNRRESEFKRIELQLQCTLEQKHISKAIKLSMTKGDLKKQIKIREDMKRKMEEAGEDTESRTLKTTPSESIIASLENNIDERIEKYETSLQKKRGEVKSKKLEVLELEERIAEGNTQLEEFNIDTNRAKKNKKNKK